MVLRLWCNPGWQVPHISVQYQRQGDDGLPSVIYASQMAMHLYGIRGKLGLWKTSCPVVVGNSCSIISRQGRLGSDAQLTGVPTLIRCSNPDQ